MKRLFAIGVLLLLLSGVSSSLQAQAAGADVARLYLVDVKSGMGAQFEAALKSHTEWRKANGDRWTWHIFMVSNGPNFGDYGIRSGNHTWADLDAYEEFLNKGAIHFFNSVGPYIHGVESLITRVDSQASQWPQDMTKVIYLEIVEYALKPGHATAFRKATRKAHSAIADSDWETHYSWEWVVNGGRVPSASLVLPHSSHSGLQAEDAKLASVLKEAYGEEKGGALLETLVGATESIQTQLVRFRPDLSILH